jgi:catechol O-methyltransferase
MRRSEEESKILKTSKLTLVEQEMANLKSALSILVGILAIILGFGFLVVRSYFPNVKSLLKLVMSGGNDGRELNCLAYVKKNARRGDSQDVLNTIDRFGWTEEWLMNVGDNKGEVLTEEVRKKQPKIALEIGAFVGYSAIRIASSLPENGRLYSVEISPANAAIAREMVSYAGLESKVTIIEGTVTTALKSFVQRNQLPPFDFVFIDHAKEYYLSDFKYLLQEHLLAPNAVIVADNIIFPGAPDYRQFVNSDKSRFESVEHNRKLEYSTMDDIIMVTKLVGGSQADL